MPYFDHNATAPLLDAARAAWLQAQDEAWQNPASLTRAAARVKLRLDAARAKLAQLLESEADRLLFTSGATEGAAAVFQQVARSLGSEQLVAVSPIEHPSVVEAARQALPADRIVTMPVGRDGVVELARLWPILPKVGAAVLMAANNETGVVQPWTELIDGCRRAGVTSICDASQWLGKLPAGGLGRADWVFGSAHKFGGPKGVGFLQGPANFPSVSLKPGGGQQKGRWGGTEDCPGVAAMVAALAVAEESKVMFETERTAWRDAFERDLSLRVPGLQVVGAGVDRLWNTSMICLPHGENTRWVAKLDQRGFQISTGSACASGKAGPSHVLTAMGFAPDEISRTVRISAGWSTTPQEWQELADAVVAVAPELKPAANVISL